MDQVKFGFVPPEPPPPEEEILPPHSPGERRCECGQWYVFKRWFDKGNGVTPFPTRCDCDKQLWQDADHWADLIDGPTPPQPLRPLKTLEEILGKKSGESLKVDPPKDDATP
jgi:hypothetical protein